jgi:hypothetical protein
MTISREHRAKKAVVIFHGRDATLQRLGIAVLNQLESLPP